MNAFPSTPSYVEGAVSVTLPFDGYMPVNEAVDGTDGTGYQCPKCGGFVSAHEAWMDFDNYAKHFKCLTGNEG